MPARAPRPPLRSWLGCVRGAAMALVLVATPAVATSPRACARFAEPTQDYRHCVLGDCTEYRRLIVNVPGRAGAGPDTYQLRLPPDRVFEDLHPRCIRHQDGPGFDVLVVETNVTQGASLALYGLRAGRLAKLAATGHIGRRNRWLAPAGTADFDGDGRLDFAYVDRPHLARVLRIVTRRGDRLVEIAQASGLTNHRIGEARIPGGVRDCGAGPEIVTANADWTRIMASRLQDGKIVSTVIRDGAGMAEFDDAMRCR